MLVSSAAAFAAASLSSWLASSCVDFKVDSASTLALAVSAAYSSASTASASNYLSLSSSYSSLILYCS